MLSTNNLLSQKTLERNKAMNWLLENFPKAFDLCNRKPLKNNILEDIYNQKLSNQPAVEALEQAFNYYTHWASYLSALKEGAICFDLKGQECGKITAQEERKANQALNIETKKSSIKNSCT